jgi:hypothetical protein
LAGFCDAFYNKFTENKYFVDQLAGHACPGVAFFQDPAGQGTSAKASPFCFHHGTREFGNRGWPGHWIAGKLLKKHSN